jgi:hypothetical protein
LGIIWLQTLDNKDSFRPLGIIKLQTPENKDSFRPLIIKTASDH